MSKQQQKEEVVPVEASAPQKNPDWTKFWHQPNFSLIEKFYHRWFHVLGFDDEEFPEGINKDFGGFVPRRLIEKYKEDDVERVLQKTDMLNSEMISPYCMTTELTEETVVRTDVGTAPALTDSCRYLQETGGWFTWRRDPRRNFEVRCNGSCEDYKKKET